MSRFQWKTYFERVAAGDRDERSLVACAVEGILKDREMTRTIVTQAATKRIRDMISGAVKPTGETPRVPAGQLDLGWLEMDPALVMERLKSEVRRAYQQMVRANNLIPVIEKIDASGLAYTDYTTFAELARAAQVPEELLAKLAA